ncbi:MAG: flagellar motor protein MotB [Saprospirales bacterium]|nr:MAG: flagellar motor protein MotB [Saprospirales bacterium]
MNHTILLISTMIMLLFSSCGGMMKIRDGNTAFELKKYALAIELLSEEYENTRYRDVKAEKAFLLAESYSRMGTYASASNWYQEAFRLGEGSRALEGFARTLKNLENYDRAAEVYQQLIENYGSLDEWENALRISLAASNWMEEADKLPFRIIEAEFNSPASDYAPVYYNKSTIVFSSDRYHPTGKGDTYSWTGRGFFNYFTYDKNLNRFTETFDFLNSEANEGTLSFTEDRNQVFFTRCKSTGEGEDGYCRLWFSERINGLWSESEKLPFQQAEGNYAHPAINAPGDMLIFSFRAKGDQGGYDLYVSYKRGPEWIEPIRLPGNVNTRGNELFPFLHNDTLYFSSDGHLGIGGLDIFRAERQSDGSWGEVFNLMPPFNSGADDFGFLVDPFHTSDDEILNRGYFSSNRNGTTDRIFYWEQYDKIEPIVEKEVTYSLQLEGIVFENLYEDPSDPNSRRLGRQNLPNALVEIIGPSGADTIRTRRDARFSTQIDYDINYIVAASADGFLRKTKKLDISGIKKNPDFPNQIVQVEIILDRKFIDREVILEDIYYDFDEWFIREDAMPTLNALVRIMEDNPEIVIELASHTDCRGTEEYNLQLSQNRAQAAVDYLVQQGIPSHRLEARGYGKSRLRVECICDECTEEEHQTNRRTTFRILGSDSG